MFLDSGNYKDHVKSLIEGSNEVRIAVAYWGMGAQKLLESASSKKRVTVICNLTSGGTNPHAIRIIKNIPGVSVRHLDDLHAKVFVGNGIAIVGSANMSTNGLNIEEDEQPNGWKEAGYQTNAVVDVQAAKAWFDLRLQEAKEITPAMWTAADEAWKRRREVRGGPTSSLIDLTPKQARERKIYVAIYTDYVDGAITTATEEMEKEHPDVYHGLSYFSDCSAMKEDHTVISVHRRGDAVTVDGAFKRQYRSINDPIVGVSLQWVKKVSKVGGFRFNSKDAKEFSRRLMTLFPARKKDLNPGYIKLEKILGMLRGQ